ncbi:putative transcription factor, K-box [Helianthus annuus]|nr:putative transcription factor, K-box [Helianthus annuus]KAJ0651809.1 putative transcription factor, K-box [Helianthus annuus]
MIQHLYIHDFWACLYILIHIYLSILIRNYVGEDLEPLNLRELQSIEQQLETALKRVRTRKNQAMHESISELHKKVIYKSVAKTSANTLLQNFRR